MTSAKEAVAEAWASIDGRLDMFKYEREHPNSRQAKTRGYYDGYLEDAEELIKRIESRGFHVVRRDK